ncbi:MAG: DNA repair protein RecO C-terminal domain-containing protein [Bacteroidales bacterium]|nr:DNA repair protein RecO C-terminal domain-containing protein [Bacteroidales bacterium]
MNLIEFIVLSSTKVGENALVVHTLSKEWGRRGFWVRSAAKAGMSHFLPLNLLEGQVVENPKSELWTLKNIGPVAPLNGIRNNIYKNTMTLFLSEVLLRMLKDGTNEDGLYEWCVGSILTLDALESDFSNFHIRFLLELAGALGFRPTLQDVAPFAGEHIGHLQPFLQCSFEESMLLPLSGDTRNALCDVLLQYLSYHTDTPIQVKSLPVLHELFR